jgi:hypothetical protein
MNYSVNSLDDAMLDRFVSIEVTANLDDYVDYSLRNHPNDDVLSFLQACPDMLLIVKKSADSTALTKSPTPRGWTKVQEILNNCSLNERLMKQLIAGILGPETASSFYGFMRDRSFKIPSADSILNDFEGIKPVIGEIISKKRLDIMNLVIKKVVMSFEADDMHMRNANAFVEYLPEELRIVFFKLMATNKPDEFERVSGSFTSFDSVSDRIIEIMMS